MKISRKLRYGLRAMISLALYYQTGYVSAKDISNSESIPLDYLEQIFNKLKQAGLVKTTRGPHGGYALSRTPSSIKIKDIMDVLDASPYLTDCLNGKAKQACNRVDSCSTKPFWQMLDKAIQSIAESTSLKDLSEKNPNQAVIKHSYLFQI